MKKVDKLVLGAFIGPFIITFCVVVFILLIQFLMKYMDELVGKGLGAEVYIELLFYCSLNMVTTALPLAVLISSLITFGNLGEHHELTAVKGAGISMIRVFMPVFIVAIALTIAGFYFNNVIVPKANLKFYSLLYDIRTKKASLNFKEGIFYEGIPGYRIKISKKYTDGKSVQGVIVYNHTSGRGNSDITIADSGQFTTFSNDRYLSFELYNGKNYAEHTGQTSKSAEQFVESKFSKSKIIFSLESFQLKRTQEELFSNNRYMKSVSELKYIADSLKNDVVLIRNGAPSLIKSYYYYYNPQPVKDSIVSKAEHFVLPKQSYSEDVKTIILNRAVNQARSVKSYISSNMERVKYSSNDANLYAVEQYKKYTLSFACIVMFLIGASLGAIIKKGGLGFPLLISIVFFLLFYVLSIIGEKWAKEGIAPVLYGVWAADVILFAVGVFFLRQAQNDSRILEADFYNILIKRYLGKKEQSLTVQS